MIEWLTDTALGKFISTFIISMAPVVELRLGLPYGIAQGLDYWAALIAAVFGNVLPVPFIIVYIERVFAWVRSRFDKLDRWITRLETKANLKGERVKKYGPIALMTFVAIPLPGTGAWTGALIAALLDMPVKKALPAIFLGVIIAAVIMTCLTYGAIIIFW